MIQRIQSVYLFLVAVLLTATAFMPIGRFVGADNVTVHVFRPLEVSLANGESQSTWGLFGILMLGAVIALGTVFLYRNRMLQIRMTVFSSILLVGFYVAFLAFTFVLQEDLEAGFRLKWGLSLPAVCIILNYLSFRAIYRDEVMVRAADRLR